ncbi:hypothetical protein SB861_55480, partial [Paraburkholderia sp. SIMBA_049]
PISPRSSRVSRHARHHEGERHPLQETAIAEMCGAAISVPMRSAGVPSISAMRHGHIDHARHGSASPEPPRAIRARTAVTPDRARRTPRRLKETA